MLQLLHLLHDWLGARNISQSPTRDAVRLTKAAHEQHLLTYATDLLREIPGLTIVGNAAEKAAVISFVLDGVHAHDVATILDREGVAVRAGHHCAQPVMQRFGVAATVRASFGLYNTREEVDALANGLHAVLGVFG